MARWRYDAQPLLRYAAVQEAPMYREIMEVFAEAAAGYRSRLSPEDFYAVLLDRLDPGDEDGAPVDMRLIGGSCNPGGPVARLLRVAGEC